MEGAVRLYEEASDEIKSTYPLSIISQIGNLAQGSAEAIIPSLCETAWLIGFFFCVLKDPILVVNEILNAVYYAYPADHIYAGYSSKLMKWDKTTLSYDKIDILIALEVNTLFF